MKWQIAKNEWILKCAPWGGAIAIEQANADSAVPVLVCWFSRDIDLQAVQQVIDDHNARQNNE
jgi:hypothetical protein